MPIVHHRRPSLASYPIWLVAWLFIKPVMSFGPIIAPVFALLAAMERWLEKRRPSRRVAIERIDLGGRPTELVLAKGPAGTNTDSAVLYLHGGAFMSCGPGTHRTVTASLATGLQVPVFALDYRQLPDGGVGTSVHDAVAAYRELLVERGYRHVVVAGDSAGGFLTAKVVELAAPNGLPAPTAVGLLSPLLDLDLGARPDRTSRYDAYLPIRQLAVLGPMFERGPVPFTGARRAAEITPTVFPPTIIITAEREMVEPDSVDLVDALDEAGVRAVLHRYAWQVHAFTVPLRHREGRESVRLLVDFLDEQIRAAHTDAAHEDKAS